MNPEGRLLSEINQAEKGKTTLSQLHIESKKHKKQQNEKTHRHRM